MHIARVHLAQVIVNVKIFIGEQSHIYNCQIGFPPLLFINLLLPAHSDYIVISIDHLSTSSHRKVVFRRGWRHWAATQDAFEYVKLGSLNYFSIYLRRWLLFLGFGNWTSGRLGSCQIV